MQCDVITYACPNSRRAILSIYCSYVYFLFQARGLSSTMGDRGTIYNKMCGKYKQRRRSPMGVHIMRSFHYSDVTNSVMASQITSLTIVYSTVYSGADQRKQQSSASLASVRGIHWWPVNSLHKGPVTRKMFPFHALISSWRHFSSLLTNICTPRCFTNLVNICTI